MKLSSLLLAASYAAAGVLPVVAQDAAVAPPKVLQVTIEYLKPGKSGSVHDKSESAFVAAMARAKFPTHYVALNSMSGRSRALYLIGYPSFAAWESDNKAIDANATLSAELDRDAVADGELLQDQSQVVLTYNEELSYRPQGDISHARYFEVTIFQIHPGHGKEFRELTKLVKDAHQKAGTSAHWATYDVAYGTDGDTFVVFSTDKSMADIDTGYAENKQFIAALGGEDGLDKFRDLYGKSVASSRSELFSINPRQSYAPEAWVKADPAFWKPKPPAAPMAKPAAKEETPKPTAH